MPRSRPQLTLSAVSRRIEEPSLCSCRRQASEVEAGGVTTKVELGAQVEKSSHGREAEGEDDAEVRREREDKLGLEVGQEVVACGGGRVCGGAG